MLGSWEDPCWDAAQSGVLRLADELHATSTVSPQLWDALATNFDEPRIIELLVTAGWYHAIDYVCNGLQIQPGE